MSGDPTQAQRVVIMSTLGTGVLTVIGTAAKLDPTNPHPTISSGRVIIGTFVAGIMLSGLAQVQPDLASGLAALMLVTSMFVVGTPAWDALSHAVGGGTADAAPGHLPAGATTTSHPLGPYLP